MTPCTHRYKLTVVSLLASVPEIPELFASHVKDDVAQPFARVSLKSGAVMSSDRAEWMTVTNCATGLEADIARAALEAEGIPVMVRSDSAGIFGLAFQGMVTGGITLQVPSPEIERAREILGEDDGRPDLRLVSNDRD